MASLLMSVCVAFALTDTKLTALLRGDHLGRQGPRVRQDRRAAGGVHSLSLAASHCAHLLHALSLTYQILPLPISRYRFKFQSNLVCDSIKPISNFCFPILNP
jgi:hypothetical protein